MTKRLSTQIGNLFLVLFLFVTIIACFPLVTIQQSFGADIQKDVFAMYAGYLVKIMEEVCRAFLSQSNRI
jgi:hypothetical protein